MMCHFSKRNQEESDTLNIQIYFGRTNRQKSTASALCDRGGRNRSGGLINTRLDFDDARSDKSCETCHSCTTTHVTGHRWLDGEEHVSFEGARSVE